jgi:hypothetical protein
MGVVKNALVLVLVLVLDPVPSREEGPRTNRSTRTRRSTDYSNML